MARRKYEVKFTHNEYSKEQSLTANVMAENEEGAKASVKRRFPSAKNIKVRPVQRGESKVNTYRS